MEPLTGGAEDGVQQLTLVFAVGLADEAFHAVAVHGVFEIAFGNANNQLIYRTFICNRFDLVKTFKRVAEKLLLFPYEVFDFHLGTEALFFRKCKSLDISVFWLH